MIRVIDRFKWGTSTEIVGGKFMSRARQMCVIFIISPARGPVLKFLTTLLHKLPKEIRSK